MGDGLFFARSSHMKKILSIGLLTFCFILNHQVSRAETPPLNSCRQAFAKIKDSTTVQVLRRSVLSLFGQNSARASQSSDFIFDDNDPNADLLGAHDRAQTTSLDEIQYSKSPESLLHSESLRNKMHQALVYFSPSTRSIPLLAHHSFDIFRHNDQLLTYPSVPGQPKLMSRVYTLDFVFHKITVVIPTSYLKNVSPYVLFASLAQLPVRRSFAFKLIRINPEDSVLDIHFQSTIYSKDHRSAMIAHKEIIDVFPGSPITAADANQFISDLRHEYGHLLAFSIYKSMVPLQYDGFIDDQNSVSKYGDTNVGEDFAEAMSVYLTEDGDFSWKGSRKKFPNRFRIIDEIMGMASQRK